VSALEEDPPNMDDSAIGIYNRVTTIIDTSADTVNRIRKQALKSSRMADEIEELADELRAIANHQNQIAQRIAQIAAESISAESFPDDEDDEWDEHSGEYFPEEDEEEDE